MVCLVCTPVLPLVEHLLSILTSCWLLHAPESRSKNLLWPFSDIFSSFNHFSSFSPEKNYFDRRPSLREMGVYNRTNSSAFFRFLISLIVELIINNYIKTFVPNWIKTTKPDNEVNFRT